MELGTMIKNSVIVAVILVVVFMSQQPNFRFLGKQTKMQGSGYWAQADAWIKTNLWVKVNGEAGKLQSSVNDEIAKQKNNFVQSLWDNFKNYFAKKFSDVFKTKVK